jgi:hypothetical protein
MTNTRKNSMADPFQEYQDLLWGTGPYAPDDSSGGPATPNRSPPDQAASSFDPSTLPPINVGILGPLTPPSGNNATQDQSQLSSAASSAAGAGRYYLPGVGMTYLDPGFANKLGGLMLAAQRDNIPLRFRYAYRDQAEQDQLKHDASAIMPADKSLHSTGNAVDIHVKPLTPAMLSRLVSDAAAAGISWGGHFPTPDRPHFYVDPGGNRARRIDAFSQAVQALKDQIPD